MALTQNQENNTKFLKIADHSICLKEKIASPGDISEQEKEEGWKYLKTVDNEGTEYHNKVLKFRAVDGYITGIEYVKRTLPGKTIEVANWKISLQDGKEHYSLDIPSTSPAASRFVKLAENLDPTQPVEFSAWKDTSDAKPKLAFMVKQNGNNVPQKYSVREIEVIEKDKPVKVTALVDYADPTNPNAPRLKVLKNGTKDWNAIEEFLFERMEGVMERFKENKVEDTYVDSDDTTEVEEDQIPF